MFRLTTSSPPREGSRGRRLSTERLDGKKRGRKRGKNVEKRIFRGGEESLSEIQPGRRPGWRWRETKPRPRCELLWPYSIQEPITFEIRSANYLRQRASVYEILICTRCRASSLLLNFWKRAFHRPPPMKGGKKIFREGRTCDLLHLIEASIFLPRVFIRTFLE